ARAWPTGAAEVVLRLEPVGAETRIVMEENAVSGPASLIPKPLQDPLLAWRNVEALRRLAYLCERREQ
ncbi:MAG: SRPBCC family protein, partial [Nocardioides sp.]|nr:SRPBCC family protein [Nocardioides sp.]